MPFLSTWVYSTSALLRYDEMWRSRSVIKKGENRLAWIKNEKTHVRFLEDKRIFIYINDVYINDHYGGLIEFIKHDFSKIKIDDDRIVSALEKKKYFIKP